MSKMYKCNHCNISEETPYVVGAPKGWGTIKFRWNYDREKQLHICPGCQEKLKLPKDTKQGTDQLYNVFRDTVLEILADEGIS